jgi:hypothetical protein
VICEGHEQNERELSAYQRAALVTCHLLSGESLQTADVMQICQMRRSGALKLLGHLAALPEMPLFLDDEGYWTLMG